MIKKYLSLLGIAVLLFFSACSSKTELVSNGKSDFKIFISKNAAKPEQYAAMELQKYLQKISGCLLPIVNENKTDDKMIYVGFQNAPHSLTHDLKPAAFGKEEYIIRSDGKNLLIAGGAPRGTLYGVLGYLGDHLGCRWYTREVVKIPEQKSIALGKIEDRQKPVMEARQISYREAYDVNWSLHNRINSNLMPDSLGSGNIAYPFVHTFYALVSPQKYGKTHPEYFSEVDGKRLIKETNTGGQLCLTNPEVVKIATATVFEWIKTHPEASVYTVDQNDGDGHCECTNCKKIDDQEGSYSGTLIHFVNQIADSVAKVYPEVKLQTLAYAYTEIPPKNIRPAKNVIIRLCHYDYCSAHPLGQCDNHKVYVERLDQWSKIASQVTIWDYYTNFERYLLPFPNFETLKHDVKFYADRKAIGLFPEGNNVSDNGGGEFSELRAWMFSQLLWNPERDAQALIDEFVLHVYGPAAPYVSEYIKMMHEQVKPKSAYFSIWTDPEDVNYLGLETIQKADSLFSMAKAIAKKDSALYKRVELAYLPVLYTRLYFYATGGTAYLSREQMPEALAAFKRILATNRITSMGVVELKPGNIPNFIKSVESSDRFIKDWWLTGPFDNENRKGFDTIYGPEKGFDSTAVFTGKNSIQTKWTRYNSNESGYIDLAKMFNLKKNVVSYAYRKFESPVARKMQFGVGSNDGVKVWVNGKLELSRPVLRAAKPNDDVITVAVKKGSNTILVKVDQLGNKWGFYFTERN